MKSFKIVVVIALTLAVAVAFCGCKKKEVKPTVATAAKTAATAVTVVCPKPGEDLICQDCKTLFTTPDEYKTHMEKTHPDKWATMKDEFTKNFPPAGTAKK